MGQVRVDAERLPRSLWTMQEPGREPCVRVLAVEHRFAGGTTALRGLDLSVAAGESISVVGPSGCGKSTLLRLLAGLAVPTSGQVEVGGRPADSGGVDGIRRGFVFQSPVLLPWRTVEENLLLPMELEGVPRAAARAAAREWLAKVGLPEFARSWPAELSGGMRMRVSIARALASRPSILLLDEPFAALDDISRSRLQEELLDLRAREGFSTVLVTHNVSEAVFLSDRVVVMSPRPGRVLGEVEVPFGFPRTADLRGEAEFARCVRETASLLREGAE